jgi:hypothetical protein
MRKDARIYTQIYEERRIEASETGCCIGWKIYITIYRLNLGPDGKCFQTSSCPKQFATFSKSIKVSGRRQPVVCGQDPRYCDNLRFSDMTFINDTSKWPRCDHPTPTELIPRRERHLHCEISGRPCCIQMHGQCRITTKEYCDFVRGSYHPNATLCSQVSCLNDGRVFKHKNSPNFFIYSVWNDSVFKNRRSRSILPSVSSSFYPCRVFKLQILITFICLDFCVLLLHALYS